MSTTWIPAPAPSSHSGRTRGNRASTNRQSPNDREQAEHHLIAPSLMTGSSAPLVRLPSVPITGASTTEMLSRVRGSSSAPAIRTSAPPVTATSEVLISRRCAAANAAIHRNPAG